MPSSEQAASGEPAGAAAEPAAATPVAAAEPAPAAPAAAVPSSPAAPATVVASGAAPAATKAKAPVSAAAATMMPGAGSLFSGSNITYRNVATAISASKSADPTYNPYYAMALSLAPNWNVTKKVYVRGGLSFTRELTHEDWTTYAGETTLSDTTVTAGYRAINIESLGLMANLEASFNLPTSKASQARTLQASSSAGITAIWSKGTVAVIGIARVAYQWHRYTTGETETPWLAGCSAIVGGCDPYIGTAARNTEWRISNFGIVSWSPLSWLGVNVQGGVISDLLYDLSEGKTRFVGNIAPSSDGVNYRELMIYGISLSARPHPGVTITVGTETANPQLAPDSTYQRPFFNRFSELFVDVQVFPDKLL